MVMLISANMLPKSCVPVPRVAEEPTWKNTLQAELPSTTTCELLAVVKVLPIWKTKIPLGLPEELRVSIPVN